MSILHNTIADALHSYERNRQAYYQVIEPEVRRVTKLVYCAKKAQEVTLAEYSGRKVYPQEFSDHTYLTWEYEDDDQTIHAELQWWCNQELRANEFIAYPANLLGNDAYISSWIRTVENETAKKIEGQRSYRQQNVDEQIKFHRDELSKWEKIKNGG